MLTQDKNTVNYEKIFKPNVDELMTTQKIISETTFYHHSEEAGEVAADLVQFKNQGWQRFNELPMPIRTNEKWRFSNVMDLSLEPFHCAEDPGRELCEQAGDYATHLSKYAGKLVFLDNHLIAHSLVSEKLTQQGVIFEPLDVAWFKHEAILKRYFQKLSTDLGGDKFEALNRAYASSGTFIYIPKGVVVKDPFVVYHLIGTENAAVFPYTLIVSEESSEVTLMDYYGSLNKDLAGLSSGIADVYALANAKVRRYPIQNFNTKTLSFQIDHNVAKRDATVSPVAVNAGSDYARFENQIYIEGEGGHIELQSLTVAAGKQQFDQRTLQVHSAPNSQSELLYKNALLDASKTIFSGMIRVEPIAQKTDAYQTNRNLLISPDAEAMSLPGLEIQANDVKCSHGSSTGQIDAEQLFYLLSRGLEKTQAEELLVYGFFEEILDTVENEEIKDCMRNLLQNKFKLREQAAQALETSKI